MQEVFERIIELMTSGIKSKDKKDIYESGLKDGMRFVLAMLHKKELNCEDYSNGWIPCGKRLPEKNGFYLVTFECGYVEYLFYGLEEKEWYFVADGKEENNESWREKAKDIIAWQPLPEPYKEASNE